MNLKAVISNKLFAHKLFAPAVGAALTMLCGLAIHEMPIGEGWENISYDCLVRFGTYPTNNVVLVVLDNAAYSAEGQARGSWDRALFANLLDKLAADKSPLAVFDVFFGAPKEAETDAALAAAMRRDQHVVLREKPEAVEYTGMRAVQTLPPLKLFADAAAGLGIAEVDETVSREPDQPPRRHWPFPSSPALKSLPWRAAELSGAQLSSTPAERWLRYYGEEGGWTTLSYHLALSKAPGYFRDKVVFIGQEPEHPEAGLSEPDKFRTPYTRWNGKAVGGVEILATTYLNLVRGDWLRRAPGWVEAGLLAGFGVLFGGGLCLARRRPACGLAVLGFLMVATGAFCPSFYTNYWFDWMTTVCGQLPCALAWAWFSEPWRRKRLPDKQGTIVLQFPTPAPRAGQPNAPDYELCGEPFGKGAYGSVWLARNAIGQWQALKAVYLSSFFGDTAPYEREFNGIKRYKPVSEKHGGLLRVEFVSQKKSEGYFYYVMELGDSLTPGWEQNPALYKPRDLASVREAAPDFRLPARECVRIGIVLCEALEFLHGQGLTHRDIKPQNIVFVGGLPKLADIGLTAEIRTNPNEGTMVGTPAYMPPPPEPSGTVQADIYGLGMVLYVIRTGRKLEFFPAVSTTLAGAADSQEFRLLNAVILKACQPDRAERFASAREMCAALRKVEQMLDGEKGG